ncbi:bifunctional glycosyltransferase/CDP-glycerol:glycerophosphate glycerophosphotransferase [Arthrobacter antioxidans]|uniref:bifunctional glycosyltransferase/CDP-glycerol:glycerophosphate glycerophosphotransferase n=1 Tax=Arthrobacter antioxidans TaxID=2895818 RepID=UPI0020001A24|nr:CDP-glycerol:glycerophosphate glycerophosphotransferase [Arthrobacter antioxidans]
MARWTNTADDAVSGIRRIAERQLRTAWQKLPAEQRTKLRQAVHPADAAKVQRRVSTLASGSARPAVPAQKPVIAISVVVSDAAQDLAATLQSILRQKFTPLTIVVVDTTGEDAIADETATYVKRDGRVTFQSAAGLSAPAARLMAVERATTRWVMSLSAGDVLAPGAMEAAIKSLKATKSDLAVGTVGVRKGSKFVTPAAQSAVHGTENLTTTLEHSPGLAGDLYLSNKVFSRSFWLEELTGVEFDGELWQAELVRTAYRRAGTIDLIPRKVSDVVGDRGSDVLTREQLCSPAILDEYLRRMTRVMTADAGSSSPDLAEQLLTRLLGEDLFPFYEVVPRTDDTYWSLLVLGTRELAALGPIAWHDIRLHNRLILAAVLDDNRADVVAICGSRSDLGSTFATTPDEGMLLAQPPYLPDLVQQPMKHLLACQDVDLRVTSKITELEWNVDGSLEISGHAYIPSIDPVTADLNIEAIVIDPDGAEIHTLVVERHRDPRIDWDANDNWTSYADSGFSTRIDPSMLLADGATASSWWLKLRLTAHDRVLESPVTRREMTGAAGSVPISPIDGQRRVAVEFKPKTGLTLVRVAPMYSATSVALEGRTLTITVEAHSAPLASKITVECAKLAIRKTAVCVDVRGNVADYRVVVPRLSAEASPRVEHQWDLRLDSGFKTPQPIAWRPDSVAFEDQHDRTRRLRLKLTGYGFLALEERRYRVEADSVVVSDDGRYLTLQGTADFTSIHAPRLVLSSGKSVIEADQVSLNVMRNQGSNRFIVRFPLMSTPWSGQEIVPEAGAYSVRYIPQKSEDNVGYWIPAAPVMQGTMPSRELRDALEVGLSRTAVAGALTVHFRPPLAPEELGRFNQQSLRNAVARADLPLRDAVLFMCFGGRRATDSTRRIFEEFQRRGATSDMYWAITDYSVTVPDGAQPVLIGSRLWYALLAGARLLVNNNNFPFYFRKREGQTYIQTWHGTPLKKLGNDVARTNFSLSYWNLMHREAGYWDALLAQNPYAADVLATCFGFTGPVITEGYPRNDSLKTVDADARRSAVRDLLGIDAGKKAILYAPTWRDDAKNTSKQYEMVTYLDFEAAQKALGDDYVILLRGHHNIAGQRQTAGNRFVIDVTEYPEVNDLYLAADVLINDYSSVMFDFCVTGKPIIFLTPDIAQYRDSTRGFYFDLEEQAPGPLLMTTPEVVNAIQSLPSIRMRYADRYRRFAETYAPMCDGSATQRVVDALPVSALSRI